MNTAVLDSIKKKS